MLEGENLRLLTNIVKSHVGVGDTDFNIIGEMLFIFKHASLLMMTIFIYPYALCLLISVAFAFALALGEWNMVGNVLSQ